MTKKHELEPKDAIIEQIVSQLDLSEITQEEFFGYNGLVKSLTTVAIVGTDILKRQFLYRIRKLN